MRRWDPLQHAPGEEALLQGLREHLRPLSGDSGQYDELLALIGPARLALLGEASHGSHEFYAERAAITRRLILEKGYNAVAVEADWPDAWRVNRYVRGLPGDADAGAALSGFQRFPTWMWRNTVVREFVEWLRAHNRGRPAAAQVGFYGIDLYSLFSSIEAVLSFLDRTDPAAARQARERYACFDHFNQDSQAYGHAASFGLKPHCEDAVIQQMRDLNRHAQEVAQAHGLDPDEAFQAQQNARLVRNAEAYYRAMFGDRVSSWNLRDSHMVETLQALDSHLGSRGGGPARIAVWAHNSHLGDAAATEMGEAGEWNVGQLARERFGAEAVLVGFSTHHGTVTAASAWDGEARCKRVRDGLPGSCEDLFHRTGVPRFLLPLRGNARLGELLAAPRLQRAIGVIYQPGTERQSHYFHTRLAAQFDAILHFDATRALEPLDPGAGWRSDEAPAAYPSGL